MRLAAKLLAAVEVSAPASHQHEFNAGQLRVALGMPKERTSGKLEITYAGADAEDPVGEACTYTLYDSREGKPRSAEYRLYFDSTELQSNTSPGDILIVVRPDQGVDLEALILPGRSALGMTVASILRAEGVEIEDRFREITSVVSASDLGALLPAAHKHIEVPDAESLVAAADQGLIAESLALGALPSTGAMAKEADRIVRSLHPGDLTPDHRIHWLLEAETALFQHIESLVGQQCLDELAVAGRIPFADAATLVMRQLQSRKSRRGQSLQNHFRSILDAHRIPYGAQCRTERNERPDFVFPGCSQYSDPVFPASALRMVACKSKVRERWRQILEEADRISVKYLLTLDPGLTDDSVAKMLASGLEVFLPAQAIQAHYSGRKVVAELATVTRLVEKLQQA